MEYCRFIYRTCHYSIMIPLFHLLFYFLLIFFSISVFSWFILFFSIFSLFKYFIFLFFISIFCPLFPIYFFGFFYLLIDSLFSIFTLFLFIFIILPFYSIPNPFFLSNLNSIAQHNIVFVLFSSPDGRSPGRHTPRYCFSYFA